MLGYHAQTDLWRGLIPAAPSKPTRPRNPRPPRTRPPEPPGTGFRSTYRWARLASSRDTTGDSTPKPPDGVGMPPRRRHICRPRPTGWARRTTCTTSSAREFRRRPLRAWPTSSPRNRYSRRAVCCAATSLVSFLASFCMASNLVAEGGCPYILSLIYR